MRKIFFKIERDLFPQVKDRFPYIYLEHGRLEVDDSSVKWVGENKEIIKLPIAVMNAILLGPGTTVTHEAVHAVSSANCLICWVGEQSLKFYALGMPPSANTQNLYKQMRMAMNSDSRLLVARRMFSIRFPGVDLSDKSLQALMGMEGQRVRALYQQTAKKYGLIWRGRSYVPGNPEQSDLVNKILTFANSLLYGLMTSLCCACGFSPRIGFVHSGSPLPFGSSEQMPFSAAFARIE